MTDDNAIELFQQFQLVSVDFHAELPVKPTDQKNYVYKAPIDLELKLGDLLVVKPKEYKVVRVNALHDDIRINTGTDQLKWVCGKVDVSDYNRRIEAEAELRGIMARAREAREREIRLKDLQNFMSEEDRKRFEALMTPTKAIK